MKKGNGMLQNTAILFIAMAITKIIGAVLKIPLANILGGLGMGYFSAAYSVFSPVFALTTAALPTVITKLVAQNVVVNRYRNVRKIKLVALKLSALLGFFGTIAILVITTPFSVYIANSPKSIPSILLIAPSLFFCCIASVYRGYFEGLCNMLPTALSQVIEAVVKATLGIIFAYITLKETGSLSLASAASVFGVTISECAGLLFIVIRSKTLGDNITEFDLQNSPSPEKSMALVRKIMREMLPITIGALVINLSSFIDLLTINNCINIAITKDKEYFLQNFMYGLKSMPVSDLSDLGNFMYGSYTGIVSSFFSLIPAMTGMVSKSALPNIAAAYECKNNYALSRNLKILFKGTFIMGLPLCFGMAVLSKPLLSALYASKPAEVAVCADPLFTLCLGGITLSIAGTLFSIFQAIGRSDLAVKLMILGSAVKLAGNLVLIPIPELNITGAAVSTVICYVAVCVIGLFILHNLLNIRIGIAKFFVKSFINAGISAFSAYLAFYFFTETYGSIVKLLFAVTVAAGVYGILIIITDMNNLKTVLFRKAN